MAAGRHSKATGVQATSGTKRRRASTSLRSLGRRATARAPPPGGHRTPAKQRTALTTMSAVASVADRSTRPDNN